MALGWEEGTQGKRQQLKPHWHKPTELSIPKQIPEHSWASEQAGTKGLLTVGVGTAGEAALPEPLVLPQTLTAPTNSILWCPPPAAPALAQPRPWHSPSPGTAPALASPPHQTPELALHSAPALPPDFIDGAQSPSWMDEELWPRPGSRKGLQTRGTKHISREMFLSQAVFTAVALRNPIREEEMSQVCTDTLHIQTFLHRRIYCIKKSDL